MRVLPIPSNCPGPNASLDVVPAIIYNAPMKDQARHIVRRLHDAGISFDPRLSPFFCEEFDLLLKAHAAGFEVYAAPVPGIEHVPGISAADRPIYCFGRKADRMRVLIRNANLILDRAERSSA